MEETDTERQQMDERVKIRISEHFVMSGEREKLKELLRTKLSERGWHDEMKKRCREVIRKKGIDRVTVEDLVEEIIPKGRALVPEDVKNGMLEKIKTFIDKEVEMELERD